MCDSVHDWWPVPGRKPMVPTWGRGDGQYLAAGPWYLPEEGVMVSTWQKAYGTYLRKGWWWVPGRRPMVPTWGRGDGQYLAAGPWYLPEEGVYTLMVVYRLMVMKMWMMMMMMMVAVVVVAAAAAAAYYSVWLLVRRWRQHHGGYLWKGHTGGILRAKTPTWRAGEIRGWWVPVLLFPSTCQWGWLSTIPVLPAVSVLLSKVHVSEGGCQLYRCYQLCQYSCFQVHASEGGCQLYRCYQLCQYSCPKYMSVRVAVNYTGGWQLPAVSVLLSKVHVSEGGCQLYRCYQLCQYSCPKYMSVRVAVNYTGVTSCVSTLVQSTCQWGWLSTIPVLPAVSVLLSKVHVSEGGCQLYRCYQLCQYSCFQVHVSEGGCQLYRCYQLCQYSCFQVHVSEGGCQLYRCYQLCQYSCPKYMSVRVAVNYTGVTSCVNCTLVSKYMPVRVAVNYTGVTSCVSTLVSKYMSVRVAVNYTGVTSCVSTLVQSTCQWGWLSTIPVLPAVSVLLSKVHASEGGCQLYRCYQLCQYSCPKYMPVRVAVNYTGVTSCVSTLVQSTCQWGWLSTIPVLTAVSVLLSKVHVSEGGCQLYRCYQLCQYSCFQVHASVSVLLVAVNYTGVTSCVSTLVQSTCQWGWLSTIPVLPAVSVLLFPSTCQWGWLSTIPVLPAVSVLLFPSTCQWGWLSTIPVLPAVSVLLSKVHVSEGGCQLYRCYQLCQYSCFQVHVSEGGCQLYRCYQLCQYSCPKYMSVRVAVNYTGVTSCVGTVVRSCFQVYVSEGGCQLYRCYQLCWHCCEGKNRGQSSFSWQLLVPKRRFSCVAWLNAKLNWGVLN